MSFTTNQHKAQYLQRLLLGRGFGLTDIALFMYHAEVPLEQAEEYLIKYLSKLPEWQTNPPQR